MVSDPNCLFRLSFAHLGLHVQVVYLCSIVLLCDSVTFLKHQWFVKRTLTNKSLKNSVENKFILFTLVIVGTSKISESLR